jgi:hypothetical protein
MHLKVFNLNFEVHFICGTQYSLFTQNIGHCLSAWKDAIINYRIQTEGGINYIAINPQEAVFLKEIDNRYIPQYLLYDKSSKLIYTYAPKPGSEEIREAINTMIK